MYEIESIRSSIRFLRDLGESGSSIFYYPAISAPSPSIYFLSYIAGSYFFVSAATSYFPLFSPDSPYLISPSAGGLVSPSAFFYKGGY